MGRGRGVNEVNKRKWYEEEERRGEKEGRKERRKEGEG